MIEQSLAKTTLDAARAFSEGGAALTKGIEEKSAEVAATLDYAPAR